LQTAGPLFSRGDTDILMKVQWFCEFTSNL
jgi:hypothetical protein